MRIKKLSAWILAGTIVCTTPAMVSAYDTQNIVNEAVDMLKSSGLDEVLSDPDNVADIIIYVKNAIDEQEVSDEQLYEVIHMAEETLQIELDDSAEKVTVKLFKQFQDVDLDEEQLREQVYKIYDKIEELGIVEDDVKGILGKMLDFVRNILE